jgi:hypothetical protein
MVIRDWLQEVYKQFKVHNILISAINITNYYVCKKTEELPLHKVLIKTIRKLRNTMTVCKYIHKKIEKLTTKIALRM